MPKFDRRACRYLIVFYLAIAPVNGWGAADPVLEWNSALLDAARKDNTPSALIARNFAIMHLAMARAILSTDIHTSDAAKQTHSEDDALFCSVWAAYQIASNLYPSQRIKFEELFASEYKTFAASCDIEMCRGRGEQIACTVLESRCQDGCTTNITYIPKSDAGQWRRAAPFYRPPELPQWAVTVKPLVLERIDQFRPAGPPPMTDSRYADAIHETESLGGKNSTVRTAEQTLIARFWSDFSYTEMPVGHWNSIARSIAETRNLPPRESARLFALLNLALADTGAATWEAKYHYNAWRPITAIARADETGNASLQSVRGWMPLLNTPPHPEYPSGHSAFSGAATAILAHFFGSDAVSFDVRSDTLTDQHRQFESFKRCAEECGLSRIYGGIHFRFSCTDGLDLGNRVGDYVWEQMLVRPLWMDEVNRPIAQQDRDICRPHREPRIGALFSSRSDRLAISYDETGGCD